MTPHVLAIDQGTSSTKAILVDRSGVIQGETSVPVGRTFPQVGWVEQNALEIWESVRSVTRELLADHGQTPVAVSITNQRESILIWDRETGQPLAPIVGWQCRRGAKTCEQMRNAGTAERIRDRTGLPLDPSFSAPKLRWLLDSDPRIRAAAEEGSVCAGTVDTWLVWNLTGGAVHVTDPGNASRTLLLDLESLAWHDELLELFHVPRACLPQIVESSHIVGEVTTLDALAGVPIAAIVPDSHAALFGLGALKPGMAKATLGTGTSLMTPTGTDVLPSAHGLAATVAWMVGEPTYALEGNILSSGATLQWAANLLGLDELELAALAAATETTDGVYLVPAFVGLAAPYWCPDVRARIEGLTFGSGPGELALAALESVAFQLVDLLQAAELDLGLRVEQLLVDGGASTNDHLVQLLADLLGRPVLRSQSPHAAAVGAAYLGGLAVGVWHSGSELSELPRRFDGFNPRDKRDVAERIRGWRTAVGRSFASDAAPRERTEALPT
jgi:glycerol kinase